MNKTNKAEGKNGDNGSSTAKKVAIGAGIAALGAAAVAGTYFLYGSKNAAKNRKQVKAWAIKAKGDILERLEGLKEVNEEVYNRVVDEVSAQYKKAKNLTAADLVEFVDEVKGHWKDISKDVKKGAGATRTTRTKSRKTSK